MLVEWMSSKVDECGQGDVRDAYNVFLQSRDDWCAEAGIDPNAANVESNDPLEDSGAYGWHVASFVGALLHVFFWLNL